MQVNDLLNKISSGLCEEKSRILNEELRKFCEEESWVSFENFQEDKNLRINIQTNKEGTNYTFEILQVLRKKSLVISSPKINIT